MLLKEVNNILKDATVRLDDKYERVQKRERFIVIDRYGHCDQLLASGSRPTVMSFASWPKIGSYKVVCTIDIMNDKIASAAYDGDNTRLFDAVLGDKTWPIWYTADKKDENWDKDNLILLLTPGV